MLTKMCSKCNVEKSLNEFFKHSTCRHGVNAQCKACAKHYVHSRKDSIKAYKTEYHIRNKEKIRNKNLLRNYGLSPDAFNILLKAQDGACKICGAVEKLDVDHSHSTGEIRGLLCGFCNRGIGIFKDSPELLYKAIRYLEETNKGAK